MRLALLLVPALSSLLLGCLVPPKLDSLAPAITGRQLGLSSDALTPSLKADWWSAFEDPQFDRLMRLTLSGNPTLMQAMARVRKAQALSDIASAGLAPDLSFNAQETRQRFSGHDIIPPPYAGTKRWEGHEGLNLSWDLDFGAARTHY